MSQPHAELKGVAKLLGLADKVNPWHCSCVLLALLSDRGGAGGCGAVLDDVPGSSAAWHIGAVRQDSTEAGLENAVAPTVPQALHTLRG